MIWLINPPSPPGMLANREGSGGLGVLSALGGFCYPPQTLAYMLGALRQAGLPGAAIDAVGEGLDLPATLVRLDTRAEAALVWVSAPTLESDLAFVRALKIARPGMRVALFGAALGQKAGVTPAARLDQGAAEGPVFVWQHALKQTGAEAALLAEPEWPQALLPLGQALADGTELADCPALGLAQSEAWRINPPPQAAWDFNNLAYPAWDALPVARYPFLTLFASRGCGDSCAYCPYVVGQGTVQRQRQPAAVVEEFAFLAQRYPKPRTLFRDPVFAANRRWVLEFCHLLQQSRLRAAWECESRPDHFDADMLQAMQRAGCQMIKIGLESADPATLSRIGRLQQGEQVEAYRRRVAETVNTCRRLGLACRVFVLIGQPGEQAESLLATLAFLQQLRPALISIKRFQPYPGLRNANLLPSPANEDELCRFEQAMLATADPPVGTGPGLLRRGWRKIKKVMGDG